MATPALRVQPPPLPDVDQRGVLTLLMRGAYLVLILATVVAVTYTRRSDDVWSKARDKVIAGCHEAAKNYVELVIKEMEERKGRQSYFRAYDHERKCEDTGLDRLTLIVDKFCSDEYGFYVTCDPSKKEVEAAEMINGLPRAYFNVTVIALNTTAFDTLPECQCPPKPPVEATVGGAVASKQ